MHAVSCCQGPCLVKSPPCVARAVCLVAAACFSSTSTEGARWFVMAAAAFLVASNVALVVLLPAIAPAHQPAAYVFTQFYDVATNPNGIPSNACAPMLSPRTIALP